MLFPESECGEHGSDAATSEDVFVGGFVLQVVIEIINVADCQKVNRFKCLGVYITMCLGVTIDQMNTELGHRVTESQQSKCRKWYHIFKKKS